MKKLTFIIALILISTFAHARSFLRQTVLVKKVIDGNTIQVAGWGAGGGIRTVRLIGIDITKMEQEATMFIKSLKGKSVRLEPGTRTSDEYGRILAYVWKEHDSRMVHLYEEVTEDCKKKALNPKLNGRFIKRKEINEYAKEYVYEMYEGCRYSELESMLNATIVQEGYAIPMTIPPNVKYADLFKELYEEARKEKRGLWK